MSKDSMYSQYDLDPKVVEEGVWFDYGSFRVLLAHSGSSNKKYTAAVEAVVAPSRRAIEKGLMSEDRSRALIYPVYAGQIVKNWEISEGLNEDGSTKWKQGIEGRDKTVLEFNVSNVVNTFKNLPLLFSEFMEMSNGLSAYRFEDKKEDAKN